MSPAHQRVEGLVSRAPLNLRPVRTGLSPLRLPGPIRGPDVEGPEPCSLERVDELVLAKFCPPQFLDRHDAESAARVFLALEEDDAVAEVVEPRLPAVLQDEDDVRLSRLHQVLLEGANQLGGVDAVPLR